MLQTSELALNLHRSYDLLFCAQIRLFLEIAFKPVGQKI
jgi:hypothetical protein